jgi:hypothetical protein
MATAMLLSTYQLTPLLHAFTQIKLFEDEVNDCAWWTFTKVVPLPPQPAPSSTTLNTRTLSDVKLCTELYGDEGRPSTSEDSNSMQLAARKDARWSPGDRLSVYFIGGSPLVREKVRLSSINH